ncbi:MAG TPA: hypothetical protein VFB70_09965 [Pyrinomonadaceae bacterium]|nr:hypothetical protein [Pyrinomonadaceae bacterium]
MNADLSAFIGVNLRLITFFGTCRQRERVLLVVEPATYPDGYIDYHR